MLLPMTKYDLSTVLTKLVGLTSLIGVVPMAIRFSFSLYNFLNLLRFMPEKATADQLLNWEFPYMLCGGIFSWLFLRRTDWVVVRILQIDRTV